MPSSYEETRYSFSPPPASIRYFKLNKSHFVDDELWKPRNGNSPSVQIKRVVLSPTEYLSLDTNLEQIKLDVRDTTVLNFQVGKGKTRLQHECMLRYLTEPDKYVIFYCAPFKRLLEQNKEEIKHLAIKRGMHPSIHNCITKQKLLNGYGIQNDGLSANIYLMTPEFLMGSGGKGYQRQSWEKTTFKDKLLKEISGGNKKIILFLDEVHEKTEMYSPIRLAHLYRIGPALLGKVFIASATFTRESVEVIKAVSMLTQRKIVVFQADRVKSLEQADLHLHICTETYKHDKLESLESGLQRVLRSNIDRGRQVHILTAQKELAKAINTNTGDLGEVMKQLESQLLTADEGKLFDEGKNSIGTTFTTGISINNANSTLIVILPGNIPSYDLGNVIYPYGIFTGGLITLVQSLARLRNGGEVHIFMPPFANYIQSANAKVNDIARSTISKLHLSPNSQSDQTEQELFNEFKAVYSAEKDMYTAFIKSIESAREKSLRKNHQDYFGFETFYAFLLSEYAGYKIAKSYPEGRQLSPLLLWLVLNDQLVNCTLKSIFIEYYKSEAANEEQQTKEAFDESLREPGLEECLLATTPQKKFKEIMRTTKPLPLPLEPVQNLRDAVNTCRDELKRKAVQIKQGIYTPEYSKPQLVNSWLMLIDAVQILREHPSVQYGLIAIPRADKSDEEIAEFLLKDGFAGVPKWKSSPIFEGSIKYRKLL